MINGKRKTENGPSHFIFHFPIVIFHLSLVSISRKLSLGFGDHFVYGIDFSHELPEHFR
jgi:hypothetical protein